MPSSSMGKESQAAKPHVYVIPYPAQGHINPALAFAKSLAAKGLLITLITTTNIRKTANFSNLTNDSITIANISDGSEEVKEPESVESYFRRFKAVYSHNLAKFFDERTSSGYCAKFIIYDSIMPWVLDIAHDRGLLGASFFTQSPAVSAIFYHVKQGSLMLPCRDSTVSLPALPALETGELPSFDKLVDDSKATVVGLLADQFSNLEKADLVFFNTFDKLENEILHWMASRWPIKTVGPTFLLLQADQKFSDNNHSISFFEPKHEACRQWLDSREDGSVVYVSFGSIASLGKEQMEELAFGLIMSSCNFLWVVRSSEVDKLPQDFTSLASEKGLIVEWCHQPEVLAHRASACFMTHCGWNSTLEALSYGVPLVAMAQWADQNTNSKFIKDVWRVGVGVKAGENGIVGREEIAMCIKEVVHGDKGVEVKRNACKWKELAHEAVRKGGTSAVNVEDFVSRFMG